MKKLKRLGKKKKLSEGITLTELWAMRCVYLVGAAIILAVCISYCAFNSFDYRLFTGLFLGLLVSVGNFLLMGRSAENAVTKKQAKQAQFSVNLGYGLRYVGMFCIFGAGMYFGLINPITALLPLFFPKIHYTLKYTVFYRDGADS